MKRPPKTESLERLQNALDAIPELKNRHRRSREFVKWRRDTEIAIRNIFGELSDEVDEFPGKNDFEYISLGEASEQRSQEYYVEKLEEVTPLLESMREQVSEYWKEERQVSAPSE